METHEFFLEHEGARLFVAARGGGRPLIFFHGGLADHRAALVMVGSLADRFRVITPDLRGSGRSRDGRPLTWDRLADDVAALCDHLGLARAWVGGVSMGSGVALRFALRHPRRVARLALVWPAFAGAARGYDAAQEVAMRAIAAHAERALVEGVDALAPLFAALPPELRARALAMAASFDVASVAATARLLASGDQPFAEPRELAQIAAPVLVVPGVDATHPAELAALYAEHLPDCRVRAAPVEAIAEAIAAFGGDGSVE